MKIWHGYGSEHSSNLVMIGHFKTTRDAKKAQQLIEQLSVGLRDKTEVGTTSERFSDEVRATLREAQCYFLGPSELEQFLYETRIQVESNRIVLTTEEFEVSAFLKLMVHKGARVEIYSAHDYPDANYGRGK